MGVITADAATGRPFDPALRLRELVDRPESIVDRRMLLGPAQQPKAANAAA